MVNLKLLFGSAITTAMIIPSIKLSNNITRIKALIFPDMKYAVITCVCHLKSPGAASSKISDAVQKYHRLRLLVSTFCALPFK